MKIYSIKDLKANIYNTPFFQQSDVHAFRAFNAECNRAVDTNMMYLYPEEFALCYMGEFNEETGILFSDIKQLAIGKRTPKN